MEIVDNRDGTMSLFTTVLDHASPAVPGTSGSVADLASRSREFAANDWAETPMMRRGSPLDRNTELLLRAPFDLSTITDAALESQHMTERARLVAYEKARGTVSVRGRRRLALVALLGLMGWRDARRSRRSPPSAATTWPKCATPRSTCCSPTAPRSSPRPVCAQATSGEVTCAGETLDGDDITVDLAGRRPDRRSR